MTDQCSQAKAIRRNRIQLSKISAVTERPISYPPPTTQDSASRQRGVLGQMRPPKPADLITIQIVCRPSAARSRSEEGLRTA